MLKTLTVSNFALIEHAAIDFAGGLNILTGETGAGKSILVDSLNTILGARVSVESIRGGADFFRVEAVFEVAADSPLRGLLADQGIALEGDDTLIISRHLSRQGKGIILANGCHIPLSILRQIGAELVDMHGQHENQALLKPETHLMLLDVFEPRIKVALEEYRRLYTAWCEANAAVEAITSDSRQRDARLDMLSWQTGEIAAADLRADEDDTLEQDILVLANAEKIVSGVSRSYALLSEGGKGFVGILSALAEIKKELETVARFDTSVQSQLSAVTDGLYQLQETASELRDYCETIEFNPQKLARLQERLDIIHKLKKKYGPTIPEILAYHQQAMTELSAITNYEERLAELTVKTAQLKEQLAGSAAGLDRLRRTAAKDMAEAICAHLGHLGMPKARLAVDVRTVDRYTATGANEVGILFSANPGEEPRPLQKVISGGELSRIALAIKTVSASRDSVGTMVFDEVDTGVGGQTAQMVAEKIALVSRDRQVLCVTHLPQIAAMADVHISVEKKVEGERTKTAVKILAGEDHQLEVTRMISGDNVTPAALRNAAEMIATAQSRKRKMVK
ncbi:MAG: DNA repair protein RecN [Negativicutes bacterium]|nr:DNA repair protein RecN [Negativicutes bacterium]